MYYLLILCTAEGVYYYPDNISQLFCYLKERKPMEGGRSLRDEKKEKRDAAGKRLLSFWQKMNREGVEFFVDGEAVRPKDAYSRAVKEDGVYMTDYVMGESGKIKQVRLDKVSRE